SASRGRRDDGSHPAFVSSRPRDSYTKPDRSPAGPPDPVDPSRADVPIETSLTGVASPPPARGPGLPPRGGAARPLRRFARMRAARALLLLLALSVLGAVIGSVLLKRAASSRTSSAPPPEAPPGDALQTIDHFEFTSTSSGRRAFKIVADRLVGVEG